ncbi:MAG TPA: 6-bladed beta-propeller [Acidobacteriota bacterium]|nr:6-bladed beta-propeller [Acidobacteriota bacterium]
MSGRAVRIALAAAAALALALAPVQAKGEGQRAKGPGAEEAVPRLDAVEFARPGNEADEAVLGRPLALALDGDSLFVADAQDSAVKVFSRDGRFVRAFGGKGQGPGELAFPSGVAVAGDGIVVADKFNSRIQTFDRSGRPRSAFPTRFLPDRVYALTPDALLVTSNPTGRRKGEPLLHVFDASGLLRWEGLEARSTGDPAYDAFLNMILIAPAGGGEFYVIHRSGERTVLRFAATGALLGRITVDGRHLSRPLELPVKRGKKRLMGFCWAAASDRGLLYLAAPAPIDGGKDLGPGREISAIDNSGKLQAVITLGRAVHRFIVDGNRVYGIDEDGELRLFEVAR